MITDPTYSLSSCTPIQIVNLPIAINDGSNIKLYNDCGCEYDQSVLQYAYSIDNVCWSCYMSYDEFVANTLNLKSDFYVRIKVQGPISKITVNGVDVPDYSTQLDSGFNFSGILNLSQNIYNPYANMDGALQLQQQLAETVNSLFGIPVYYFKLSPNAKSKDLTFKEYTLMDVESVKQVKLIIEENTMPSSRPEFSDFGLDFQNDWVTEISKGQFAAAFGNNVQPIEGDLIYIPMMKRMWMVNEAYEEKNGNLMWTATTFTLALVKYQEKSSVDLKDTESLVNSFVKNKYEDLFGNDDMSTYDSEEKANDAPLETSSLKLYKVYKSDATRKYVTCDSVNIEQTESTYYKGTMISDSFYTFENVLGNSSIIYQQQYCGDQITISFLVKPSFENYSGVLFNIGRYKFTIEQNNLASHISFNIDKNMHLELLNNNWNFVIIRWSKSMNIFDAHSYKYVHKENVPQYMLAKHHYWYDIDNPISEYVSKFNIELVMPNKVDVELHNLHGAITNIKVFDIYNDDTSEILQMYPTHQHILINDTCRKIFDETGA